MTHSGGEIHPQMLGETAQPNVIGARHVVVAKRPMDTQDDLSLPLTIRLFTIKHSSIFTSMS